MAGLIRPEEAKELGSGLKKLYKMALEPGKNSRDLGFVGKEFLNSSDMRPGYFSTPVDLPKGNINQRLEQINEWNKLIGDRRLEQIPADGRFNNGPLGFKDRQQNSFSDFGTSFTGERQAIVDALKARDRMPPGTTSYSPTLFGDTDKNLVGSGGKDFYNAALTHILGMPEKPVNTVGMLTEPNDKRRTMNMLPMYEKHGPEANRILMAESQLTAPQPYRPGGIGYARMQDFHSMPLEQQLGLMNSIVGQNVGHDVGESGILALSSARRAPPGTFMGAMTDSNLKKWQALGMDPEAPFEPNFKDADPDKYQALARLMHEVNRVGRWDAPTTGYDSLRRATLANEFNQGATWKDAPEWLTKGLGRATGGRVPSPNPGQMRQLAGPLSSLPLVR